MNTVDTYKVKLYDAQGNLLVLPSSLGQKPQAQSLAVVPASDWGAFDATNRLRVSGYGKASAAGDTPILVTAAGRQQLSAGSGGLGSTGVAAPLGIHDSTDTIRLLGIVPFKYNGATYDAERLNNSISAFASAARTASANTDIINYSNRLMSVFLNITVAPNTASTITLSIRVKDSIGGNYVTLLSSAAILGSASQTPPYTNRYAVALGETPVANVAVAMALGRTMNILVTHSNADSWTYSVSADMGV